MKAPKVLDGSKLNVSFQQKPPRLVRWGFHPSPYNPLMVGLTPEGVLCRIEFTKGRKADAILKEWKKAWPETVFTQDKSATAAVLAKVLKGGAAKLMMTGTPFQQDVWKTMLKIPAGQTLSYADVAKKIKRPKAVRAVGTACGANPIPILVPCHRIVGSNGGLGGFGGGLTLKRALLEVEGVLDQAA
ncbi:MAG: methylated-DNA--[protein]-cysteine S-methyltransferase [Alphaproteobacteria bacterium]